MKQQILIRLSGLQWRSRSRGFSKTHQSRSPRPFSRWCQLTLVVWTPVEVDHLGASNAHFRLRAPSFRSITRGAPLFSSCKPYMCPHLQISCPPKLFPSESEVDRSPSHTSQIIANWCVTRKGKTTKKDCDSPGSCLRRENLVMVWRNQYTPTVKWNTRGHRRKSCRANPEDFCDDCEAILVPLQVYLRLEIKTLLLSRSGRWMPT